jgi:hypothetical protein
MDYSLSYINNKAFKINTLPSGLTIIIAGSKDAKKRGHFEIVPLDNMPEATYLAKLKEIKKDNAQ